MKHLKLLMPAILTASFTVCGVANAGVINTYQFVDNGSAWTTYGSISPALGSGPYNTLGASHTFAGSNGLNVDVSFFENVNKTTGAGGTAVNGYWGHGVTVAGTDGAADRVDNDGEAVLFEFAEDVKGLSSFFYGYASWDKSDVSVFYNDSGSWTSLATQSFSNFLSLDLNNVISDKFLFVNVDTSGRRNGNDTWAFKGLAVETITKVPEPASIALLGLGAVALRLARRKQKV